MNAFIYAQSDGYEILGSRIMGRQVAGRAFFTEALAAPETARFLVPHGDEIARLEAFARSQGASPGGVTIAAAMDDPRVVRAGAISYFDVGKFLDATWVRRAGGLNLSLTGLTHSISDPTSRAMVTALARAPTRGHDALVCTSHAIRAAVTAMIEAEVEDLADRFGGSRPVDLPQLPIIPLGVNPRAISPEQAQANRAAWRNKLGIGASDLVVLFFGRIAFHAKAHPLAMYVALEEAARSTGAKLHLIQAGWFPNEEIERAFREAANLLAPHVRHHVLDGRLEDVRAGIWDAADIFTSLSDTIEESFGLTPLEAMAAGLPVVLSDWDGYRDSVEHGVQGFLIPTLIPAAGAGAEIAQALCDGRIDFDSYEGFAALATAVDIAAARDAFIALIQEPERRAAMGQAGRARIRDHYTWPHIFARHQELWRELGARRASAPVQPARTISGDLDPFILFAGHASAVMTPTITLRLARGAEAYGNAVARLGMNTFGRDFIAPNAVTIRILGLFHERADWTLGDLITSLPTSSEAVIQLSIGWLLKMGLIEQTRPGT